MTTERMDLASLIREAAEADQASSPPAPASTETPQSNPDPQDSSESEGQEASAPEVVAAEEASNQQSKPKEDVEEIYISDDSGRRKIRIDYNDRERIKKYVSAAYGMRKFQVERDRATAKLKEMEPEYRDLKTGWDAIEKAFQGEGLKGLVNLITNQPDGYEKLVEREYARRQQRENASPDEIARLDLEDKYAQEKKERERIQKQMDEHLSTVTKHKESAEEAEARSLTAPAFEKYRFTGKLGSPEAERGLDKTLWNEAIESLSNLPDHVQVTPALVERTFRDLSSKYKAVFKQQAEEKTKQVISRKKLDTQERASVNAVKSPVKPSSAMDRINNGDIGGGFKEFFTNGWKF